MPNTAFTKYNNKGFWIPESFIEVLCEYICDTFESIGVNNFTVSLQKIYHDCNFSRFGSCIGMVNILLDEIQDLIDVKTFINVLEQTKSHLSSVGSELSIAVLDQFESRKLAASFMNKWVLPIQTQSLIATIDIIIQMLNGAWTSSSYRVWYKGFPAINGVSLI